MKKQRFLGEKVQYGLTLGEETVKYGAAGYMIKLLYTIREMIAIDVAQKAYSIVSELEEKVTDPIIKHTAIVGKGAINAEKWHESIWSTILGQTEEKKAARVEKYLGKKETNTVSEPNTRAIVRQLSKPDYITPNKPDTGNSILAASLLIGATIGYLKARKEYKISKHSEVKK
jgi:hypothetical protein